MKVTVIGGGPGGLYFALLAKKAWPRWELAVLERNRPDDTFGFGVVFSDQTLDTFKAYDLVSYERIRRRFAYWGDVDVVYKGRVMRSGGNGFCGCSRVALLNILQDRGRELGVQMRFQREVQGLEEFGDSDLIVAADGINSVIRSRYKEHFQPSVDLRPNKFTWLGSTRPIDAFKYFFRETPEGVLLAHVYQYEPDRSTWVIEMDDDTWRNFGFDKLSETDMLPVLERVFAEELDGHPLIANRSLWRNFPNITNKTWVRDNAVLVGDAKATAHFSIGSGTKLAMEDAIALFEAFKKHQAVSPALREYDTARREEVEKTQHAANVSLAWFEHMKRYWGMEPPQFAFGVMSRSKQITWENLELRDPAFIKDIHGWFARQVRAQGFELDPENPPVPMFTPFRLRDMVLDNRVVVSPMDQYCALDGVPGDWHFVHLGSRAVGGAGLVYVEMTCPSPEARISPGDTGLWNETQRDAFKRIVQFCKTHSRARMCMQLGHSGRKGSTQLGWERMDHPLESGNWPVVSASPIPYYEGISQTPREAAKSDLQRITDEFARSTRYADEAGFDMLELHMAHGYLLASFISPLTNRRTDAYGGSIENRMRFPLEVFRACRAVWPAAKPMSVRISATDWAPGGLSGEDLIALTRMLKQAGCDLIDCSTGQTVPYQRPVYGRMYQAPYADWVRNEVGIATMTVGAVTTPDQVNTLLAAGKADLVALARPHLANPYFTLQASAWYQHLPQYWPPQYLPGRDQAFRNAARERAEQKDLRIKARPASHEVTEVGGEESGVIILWELGGRDDRRYSLFSWRTRMALVHKGLAFETRPVCMSDKAAIAFSGGKTVPVIGDGETVVRDSWKIAEHLEARYPQKPLFGGDIGRGVTHAFNTWVDRALVGPMLEVLARHIHERVDPADERHFRAMAERVCGRTLEELRAGEDDALKRLGRGLEPMQALLKRQAYVCGELPAYADYALFSIFQWARVMSPRELLAPEDPLSAWRERVLDLFGGFARNVTTA